MAQTKQRNYIPLALLAFVLALAFWIVANNIDVYRYAVLGAIFEILALPMILVLFGSPVLALVLWIIRIKKKPTV